MAHSSCYLFIFIFFITYPTTSSSSYLCEETAYCDMYEPRIQFPFQLIRDQLNHQTNNSNNNNISRCGYPGFELTCNKKRQTMIHIPNSGHFLVDTISYIDQKIWIRDPNNCLPKKFLNNEFNLKDSIFQLTDDYVLMDFTFFNCSSNVTDQYPLRPVIPCLSSDQDLNYSVVAVPSDPNFSSPWAEWCDPISSTSVPYSITDRLYWMDLNADIGLQWNTPSCGNCVAQNGQCEFLKDSGLEVACYLPHHGGISKFAKFGLTFGVGIPGFLCLVWIVYLCKGKRRENEERNDIEMNSNNNVAGRSSVMIMGLDVEAIEKYPVTRIGDSGRLPDPNNNVCSICLGEYQPQDVLRSIPDCNHYFHANCIDSWLHMNATCPLCRKLAHS